MSIIHHLISRRTFLKQVSIQLLVLAFSPHLLYVTDQTSTYAAPAANAYGQQAYGFDTYSEAGSTINLTQQIFLPIVIKEDN